MKGRGEASFVGCAPFAKIFPGPLGAPRGADATLDGTPEPGCWGPRRPLGPCRVAGTREATGCCKGMELV